MRVMEREKKERKIEIYAAPTASLIDDDDNNDNDRTPMALRSE